MNCRKHGTDRRESCYIPGMKNTPGIPLALVAAALLICCASASPADPDTEDARPVKTVDHVDLERYAGLWHEIAKIPNRFQKKCARATTAEYTLRDDGRITVLNRCVKADGETDSAEGVKPSWTGANARGA